MGKNIIEWVLLAVIVLFFSHVVMVGMVSYAQWNNYFTLNLGEWDGLCRVLYAIVQGWIVVAIIYAIAKKDSDNETSN